MTAGKSSIKHTDSAIANIGQGTAAVPTFTIANTDVGIRATTGVTQIIKDEASNAEIVNVGDFIKYVNICIEVGPRNVTGDVPIPDDNGWLEWAFVCQNEINQVPTTTNLGTKTLMDVCNKVFRENCIYTGCVPVGNIQPVSVDIVIKIPKKFQKFTQGGNYLLFCFFRSVNSADVRTDSHRLVRSTIFKSWS